MYKLQFLTIISLFFYNCAIHHNDTAVNLLYDILMIDPKYNYTLLDSTIEILDTIPPVLFSTNDYWEYYGYGRSWTGGISGEPDNFKCNIEVSKVTDSSITISNSDHSSHQITYIKNKSYYTGKTFKGSSVLLYDYSYSKAIKMDDGTFTFRANDSIRSNSSYSHREYSKRIINTKYGLLLEQWSSSTGNMTGGSAYIFLLRKSGNDCLAAKILNEFIVKENLL